MKLDLAAILRKSEVVARCREALETDDMLSVAPRDDWAALLDMTEEASRGVLSLLPIVEAAKEVARVAMDQVFWGSPELLDAVEKLVKAVEGKP